MPREPYVRELLKYQLAPFVVPPGELFVLGDNRNQSVDSHVWGSVPVANVVGKAFYVLWPVNRQGFVDELMQNLEVTRDATAFVEEVTEVTERKLEDLGFTKGGDETALRFSYQLAEHLRPILLGLPKDTPIIATHCFVGLAASSQ